MNEPNDPFTLSLVVAVADNGVIGRGGELPWRLRSDLRRFRELTMGHPLIMGRRTFDSIGKPLDGRDSIVLTHGETAEPLSARDELFFALSLGSALELAQRRAQERGVNEVFIIGGAGLFSQSLPLAQKVYLTRVHGSPNGDVRWEPPSGGEWIELSRQHRPAGARDEFAVTDLVLQRVKRA